MITAEDIAARLLKNQEVRTRFPVIKIAKYIPSIAQSVFRGTVAEVLHGDFLEKYVLNYGPKESVDLGVCFDEKEGFVRLSLIAV